MERPLMTKATEVSSEERLRHSGLRPTRQRVALADLIFAKGDRHLTVEELHEEAVMAGVPVSLATVYNTLHQFTEAGMIRVLAVESAKTYFDTNVSDHHHFFIEGQNEVLDIPVSNIQIDNLPAPPEGMEISHVDVVIRLRRKNGR
jgi:Fur family iron response transcriptional regulator